MSIQPRFDVLSTIVERHLGIFWNIKLGSDNPALWINFTIWICCMVHKVPVKAMAVWNNPDITTLVFELKDIALGLRRFLPL